MGAFIMGDNSKKKNYLKRLYKYCKKKCKKNYRWEGWKKESKNLIVSINAFIDNFSEWLDNQWIEFKKTLLDDLGDIILMIIISTICLFFIKEIPSTRVSMLIVMLFVSIFAVSHCLRKLFNIGSINVINIFIIIMILISIFKIVNNYLIKLLISILALWIALIFCKKGLEQAGLYPEIFTEISSWFKRKGNQ